MRGLGDRLKRNSSGRLAQKAQKAQKMSSEIRPIDLLWWQRKPTIAFSVMLDNFGGVRMAQPIMLSLSSLPSVGAAFLSAIALATEERRDSYASPRSDRGMKPLLHSARVDQSTKLPG